MSRSQNNLLSLAVVLAVWVAGTLANAAVISVKFVGGNGGQAVTTTAGAVPAGNWNNIIGGGSGSLSTVNDSLGNDAADLTYAVNGVWGSGITVTNGDTALMSGYSDNFGPYDYQFPAVPLGTITISGLSGDFTANGYSILAYFNGDTSGVRVFTATDGNSNTDTRYGLQTTGSANYPLTPNYVAGTATTAGTATASNYVLLSGFNGSSVTLTSLVQAGGVNRTVLNGFQIVSNAPVPEPSAFVLGLGSLLAFFGYRRRSH